MVATPVEKKRIKKKSVKKKKDEPRKAALKKSRKSSAMDLVSLVWDGSIGSHAIDFKNKKYPDWERVNRSMYRAVDLAIYSRLHFSTKDFKTFEAKFGMNYWAGRKDHMLGESLYASAVQSENLSACLSFEAWKDRKPYFLENKRIYVGRKFKWKGKLVTCTSFAQDSSYLIACSYETVGPVGTPTKKVDKRFTIKYEDLPKENKTQ